MEQAAPSIIAPFQKAGSFFFDTFFPLFFPSKRSYAPLFRPCISFVPQARSRRRRNILLPLPLSSVSFYFSTVFHHRLINAATRNPTIWPISVPSTVASFIYSTLSRHFPPSFAPLIMESALNSMDTIATSLVTSNLSRLPTICNNDFITGCGTGFWTNIYNRCTNVVCMYAIKRDLIALTTKIYNIIGILVF